MGQLGWILAIAVFLAPECAEVTKVASVAVATSAQEQTRLTNADVVAMIQAGFEKATIIAAMHTLETAFDTSIEGLRALRAAGVPEGIIMEMLSPASVDTPSKPESVWRIGTFDQRNDDLDPVEEFPPTVHYWIAPDGSHDGHFPGVHLPQDGRRTNSHVIHIDFFADSGEYLLSIGQPLTRRPETILVLLDGVPVNEYTTAVEYKIHEIPLRISRSGQHTLTFDRFSGNDGYWFDALELKRTAPI